MAYALLYVDGSSAIATFETREEATERLTRFVADHPEIRDDVALLELDDRGRGIGDYIYADSHSALFA